MPTTSLSSSLSSFQQQQQPAAAAAAAAAASVFRLHDYVHVQEDRALFQQLIHPKVQKLLDQEGTHELLTQTCRETKTEDIQPYLQILHNIMDKPDYYEEHEVQQRFEPKIKKNNNKQKAKIPNTEQTLDICPVIFLFYFEGGTQMTQIWLDYYQNILQKRCLNFIVNQRHVENQELTSILTKDHGYSIVGQAHKKQDKTISMSLDVLKQQYGDNLLVSVNDLDHLLVWFDTTAVTPTNKDTTTTTTVPSPEASYVKVRDEYFESYGTSTESAGIPYRYSTYTDIVLLYVYELLSTKGCSNQNVREKYVVPCTCLMKNNTEYVSTVLRPASSSSTTQTVRSAAGGASSSNNNNNTLIWSEYGKTNRFHPTANFYLNRTLERTKDARTNRYAYSIGTVYANLRNYQRDVITHHKIGWQTKKVHSNAKYAGIIHARSDNMIQSLSKYHHFLENQHLNMFRDSETSSINDALECSVIATQGIIDTEKKCRKVKEFANILVIGHQKRSCLKAGYTEAYCQADMTCCLTYWHLKYNNTK